MNVRDVRTIDGINVHSHISGLGAIQDKIQNCGDGFVGQVKARRAMVLVKKLVESDSGGRILLLKGDSGTGKTALAIGLAKSLGTKHFNLISGTEIYSLQMSKCEALIQALRKSMGVRIRETVKVIEGEVVSLMPTRVVLKTTDMESSFEIGQNMRDELEREQVGVGDVIRILKEQGKVIKQGTSTVKRNDVVGNDIRFIPCPEGELIKVVEEVQEISLHDIDAVNNKAQGYLSLFSGETGEIKAEVRDEVNSKIWNWINEGKAEIVKGVLFIDEVHMLDIESFAFLNKAIEDDFCPVLILSSNKKEAVIRGTNEIGAFGMPRDFIDRTLIVSTESYSAEELKQILQLRAEEEDIQTDPASWEMLTEIALKHGIRYAQNILTIAGVRATVRSSNVMNADIGRSYELFLDERRAVEKFNN